MTEEASEKATKRPLAGSETLETGPLSLQPGQKPISEWQLETDSEESVLDYLKALPRRWQQGEFSQERQPKAKSEANEPSPQAKNPWQLYLFVFGLLIYLATRLIAIDQYPITFFSDEAIQTLHAQALWRNGLQDPAGRFLPLYFSNGGQYNLSLSVYLQLLIAPFARSIALTRSLPALLSLLAPLLSGLALRNYFRRDIWWLAPFVFSVIPAWFLHSRTALETSLGASIFALMLYAYLHYRLIDPNTLPWVILAAALCFYSYSALQIVVILSAILLLVLDWPYHRQHKKALLWGVASLVIVILPYLVFRRNNPQALNFQLNLLGSYWLEDKPLMLKLGDFFWRWLKAINPLYWFLPNRQDLARHSMSGYGNLPLYLFPFVFWGFWRVIKTWRDPGSRTLLIALLSAPAGAALVEPAITRLLVVVVPMVWLGCLGLDALLDHFKAKLTNVRSALISAAILSFASVYMLVDALRNGPLWFEDYGLYGMQWGAPAIFDEIQDWRAALPQDEVVLSPTWANGTDTLARFCLPDSPLLRLESYQSWTLNREPLNENTLLVMTPQEYTALIQEPKFLPPRVLRTLDYPNGQPGFYFVRLQYSPRADALFAEELAERQRPLGATLELLGRPAQITYPRLDIGSIEMLFDGDPNSLVRGLEANPFTIQISFTEPVSLEGIELRLGAPAMRVGASVALKGGGEQRYVSDVPESELIRPVILRFDGAHLAEGITLSLEQLDGLVPAHIHIWELKLNP